jgi:hypothetical protein
MSEQKHPAGAPGVWKKPNFGLIVAISAVFILLVLLGAYFFARKDSSDVVPKIRQGSLHTRMLDRG